MQDDSFEQMRSVVLAVLGVAGLWGLVGPGFWVGIKGGLLLIGAGVVFVMIGSFIYRPHR
jgi:hypothetical protein